MFICHFGYTFLVIFRSQVLFERTPENIVLNFGGKWGVGGIFWDQIRISRPRISKWCWRLVLKKFVRFTILNLMNSQISFFLLMIGDTARQNREITQQGHTFHPRDSGTMSYTVSYQWVLVSLGKLHSQTHTIRRTLVFEWQFGCNLRHLFNLWTKIAYTLHGPLTSRIDCLFCAVWR